MSDADLFRPYDPPLPPGPGGVPEPSALWERAALFFSRLIARIGSTATLCRRWSLPRDERRELLAMLVPVEKIVRIWIVTRALDWLATTKEGRRLLNTSPLMTQPPPRRAPGPPASAPEAEREIRDPCDPSTWRGRFRIMRVHWPEREAPPPEPPSAPAPVRLILATPHPDWPAPAALGLARRIEALDRAIAQPDAVIAHTARFIASLPRECFEDDWSIWIPVDPRWVHGHSEVRALRLHTGHCLEACKRALEPG